MEYHISLSKKNMSIFYKINAYLFDRFSFSFADAAFPISHFLSNYIKKHHPQLKQLLLPSFTDFEEINNVTKSQEISMKYFMYCGSSAYMDVVYFMIDSYMTIGHGDIKLLLVLNGSGIEKTYQYVKKKNAEDKVIIKSKLTHDALFSYYKQATALLIPLRDTQQDQARFPHKISEYLATGRPIVTTAVGEVNYYLQDMETAYIASAYTLTEFAYKMKSVILDEEMANRIGENGRLYGSKIFDYKQYGEQIISFIDRL
jgi:glycosyltransferase involved in cell wall biosynthesis